MKPNSSQVNDEFIMADTVADRARTIWLMRVHSAFRTALACAIVSGITLYTPKFIHSHVKFATFSYLTAVLIVSDATLGDGLKGCWHALCATVQVVPLAMLARWRFDPKPGVPIHMAALAMFVGSFPVGLPESTHIMVKRIAFGQIVLVCADAVFTSDGLSPGYMHPVHVATSTATGALAALLALLIPFPDLASTKVGTLCRIYAENASERMDFCMRAFSSRDNLTKRELISQANPISETGAKLMQSITNLEEGMRWERYPKPNLYCTEDRLQYMELPMRGIEYSLVSSPALPDQVVGQPQISDALQDLSIQLQQKNAQFKCVSPKNSKTGPVTYEQKPLLPLEQFFPLDKYEWVYFFFSCIDMLLNDTDDNVHEIPSNSEKADSAFFRKLKAWILKLTSKSRLKFAFKCSSSLGLALLIGLIFDKENGVWAALTIAISFVNGKQAVFTVANMRAQGTAMGSAYGVICRFLFSYPEARLMSLLPWIIFTSFLRNSRMYGQTGAVSAAIGALLILGRKNFGDPNEFAIARLTEVFIGLSCFIVVEFFLQPTRAATFANSHLYLTLQALQKCIEVPGSYEKKEVATKFHEMRDKQRNLKSLVDELEKLVEDAEMEPDFWFLPFRTSCYRKLIGSMSNITDMLYFITFNMEKLEGSPKSCSTERMELQELMNNELQPVWEALRSSLKYLEKINLIKSQPDSEKPKEDKFRDLEVGKLQKTGMLNAFVAEYEEAEKQTEDSIEETELREKTVRSLGAMRFCISALRKEIQETEICIKEIALWANSSRK